MKLKKLFGITYWILVIFIFLVAFFLIFSSFSFFGSYKIFIVQSGSMEPAVKRGSVIVVKWEKEYKIGEIITFGPFNKIKSPTTHRIYDIKIVNNNPIYITKGDANNFPDFKEVEKKDILGKVLFSIPFLGYLVAFVKKPVGFILLVIIPSLIIIFDETRKIISYLKKR